MSDLRVYARHGVGAQEHAVGNEFAVDLRLVYDATEAMRTDDVAAALNYAEAVDEVKRVMAEPSKLLENVAARLRDALTARFPQIESGTVCVRKIAPPIAATLGYVAFTLEF